jgi:hypothetical protein
VGLLYYRVKADVLESLRPLIDAHESEMVGPRARGYWFDRPDTYDYNGVRDTARQLDDAGRTNAIDSLELSEVEAHSLSLLDITLPADDLEFSPALFLTSANADQLRHYFKIAARRLGTDPEQIAIGVSQDNSDPRFSGYLDKQVRHLKAILPSVWRFHRQALDAGDSVLVIDLRARDIEIPEEIELAIY